MAREFIYYMHGLTKSYGGAKKVLDNIHLQFYPDAKIGMLGPNGSGKSTLLKIMAGLDKEFTGEAWLAKGATVGYLSQEPQLDASKDVMDNVMEGVAKEQAHDRRATTQLMMDYSDENAEKAREAPGHDRRQNLWDLDQQVEMAMDALRCPPGDADVNTLSGGERAASRSAACCWRSRTCCCSTSRPTISTPKSVAWLEKHLREYPGAVLIITHDRYFLDNVTGWILELDRGRDIPYEGNYSTYLEKKAKRLAQEGREEAARQKAIKREREWIGARPRPVRPSPRRASRLMTSCSPQRGAADARQCADRHSTGPRLGDVVIEVDSLSKGYGDKLLIDDLSFKLPPGGIVGVIGPNGAGKIDAVPA